MGQQAVILLAEDREDDILLVRKAFESAAMDCRIEVVHDGEEAILYLSGEGKFGNRTEYPFPNLVLLDLKMPRVDGFEVLRWIRQHRALSNLRVVVLTSSHQIRDVNQAYRLGANSFLVKPLDFENFVETSKALRNYWLVLDNPPQVPAPPAEQTQRGVSANAGASSPVSPHSTAAVSPARPGAS
jgi:CheY-like chemotaxis protein